MRTLIVEDEFVSRMYLQRLLSKYGHCDIAADGQEAIDAFLLALKNKKPYDLICMDILMPNLDGRESMRRIRQREKELGLRGPKEVKIIMTTTVCDTSNVMGALQDGATSYIIKPIEKQKITEELLRLGLIEQKNQ